MDFFLASDSGLGVAFSTGRGSTFVTGLTGFLAASLTGTTAFGAGVVDGWVASESTLAVGSEVCTGAVRAVSLRSEERRDGQGGASTYRTRWSPDHKKK